MLTSLLLGRSLGLPISSTLPAHVAHLNRDVVATLLRTIPM
ncbi:MAG TPA: hypothetical protein VFH48_43770 [Chloroflexota bacterium]|nr:hypothetical protein [Chloroflexota bacterium]